jgi:uncharacterized protein YbcI
MEDKTSKPTYGQLEQKLSQRIQALYLAHVGHQPNTVSCQLIDKTLTIIIDNPITQLERFLVGSGKQQLAQQLRFSIHKAFQPLLKALIEEVAGVGVVDLFGNSDIQTGHTTVIAVLAAPPQVGNLS